MTKRIISQISRALPGIRIIPPSQRKREKCVIYRFCPSGGVTRRRNMRFELRFVAPSLAEAREMYGTVRDAIISDGDSSADRKRSFICKYKRSR